VDEADPVDREELGESLGAVAVDECTVTFRRQIRTNDVWSVIAGPRGAVGHRLIENQTLRRVQETRAVRDASRDESSRQRLAGWSKVRIEDDLSIAIRRSGRELRYVFLFGDGASFGGGSSELTSFRGPGPLERLRSALSGRRSGVRSFRPR